MDEDRITSVINSWKSELIVCDKWNSCDKKFKSKNIRKDIEEYLLIIDNYIDTCDDIVYGDEMDMINMGMRANLCNCHHCKDDEYKGTVNIVGVIDTEITPPNPFI